MTSQRFGCNDGLSLAARMRDKRDRSRARTERMVQVQHEGDAAYARCRDLSDTGMKLDLTVPLAINDRVTVALSPGLVLHGAVAWLSEGECGIVFDAPVNSAALLHATEIPATADLLERHQSQVCTTSTKREPTSPIARFRPGLAVTVMIGLDQEQRCIVRWAIDNFAALEFAPASAAEGRRRLALPPPD